MFHECFLDVLFCAILSYWNMLMGKKKRLRLFYTLSLHHYHLALPVEIQELSRDSGVSFVITSVYWRPGLSAHLNRMSYRQPVILQKCSLAWLWDGKDGNLPPFSPQFEEIHSWLRPSQGSPDIRCGEWLDYGRPLLATPPHPTPYSPTPSGGSAHGSIPRLWPWLRRAALWLISPVGVKRGALARGACEETPVRH